MAGSKKVRKIGTVKFSELIPGVGRDVAIGIASRLNAKHNVTDTYDPQFINVLVAETAAKAVSLELDIVMVDPGKLKACTPLVRSRPEIPRYEEAWRKGDRFPPIVVDSSLTWPKMLHEGWHRACSAARVGIPEIEAIDIGTADLEAMDGWIKERQE